MPKRLQQAILEVPPPYRLVLVLHDVEELSTDEVARVLNLKEGNVRVRLHRARLFARRVLLQPAPRLADKAEGAQGTPNPNSPDGTKPRSVRPRNCKQIFANLSDYLDGVLDDALCAELERHMAGCKPCAAFLASLRNTIEQTHTLPSQRPEPRAAAQIRAHLAQQLQTPAAMDK